MIKRIIYIIFWIGAVLIGLLWVLLREEPIRRANGKDINVYGRYRRGLK